MKTKRILSTAAVLAGLVSGAAFTTQTANAQSAAQTVNQQNQINSIEIDSVNFKHYNVLNATFKTPLYETDYYVDLAIGEEGFNDKIANVVVENGVYVGINFNLDELVKKYPTTADREELFNSLTIRCYALDGSGFHIAPKLTNQELKNEVLRYNYLGDVVDLKAVSNLRRFSSFNKFFTEQRVSGNSILDSGLITTKTTALQFKFNPKFEKGYTYTVTDSSGMFSGKTFIAANAFFVKAPEGETFLPKEYTVSAKSDTTGIIYTLAKFTPFNLF